MEKKVKIQKIANLKIAANPFRIAINSVDDIAAFLSRRQMAKNQDSQDSSKKKINILPE